MLLTVVEDREPTPEVCALARSLDPVVEAVAYGADPGPRELARWGVTAVHRIRHELLDAYAPEGYGEALAQLVARLRPSGVLAAATEHGTEILAHAAARAGLPLATDCVSVTGGDPWRLVRSRGGGMLLEEAELAAPVKLVTVAPAAAVPAAGPPHAVGECAVAEFVPELEPRHVRARVVERAARTEGTGLATASVVVSGGRGVGSAEGYAVLEELAGLLGGAVGCSRVATGNGWRPHRDQVGLTGTRIAPEVYLACGISGATQHWVGCMDARTIIAVNTDPDAAMVARADYAVIGDLHEVLPAMVAEIRARRSVHSGPVVSEERG
ncbi:electron transfer flavoprotein alpha subunit apoprotein [Prauserella shujinwangii]|uniref:Electron transfer flavoprotein alpha subunit apoprotein n=1 Tax=Prauserella shujinwangii TaxID=1453103 RepID=A0A2T0M436_9PSEU|nr:electron transfer flavoprotein subunit alpha/FixB family protein [Prauserella shujinwangii]PRX51472.1 electron transfer flavoprotein alpha subunit apoprotein [Prauserella shujinwangii]